MKLENVGKQRDPNGPNTRRSVSAFVHRQSYKCSSFTCVFARQQRKVTAEADLWFLNLRELDLVVQCWLGSARLGLQIQLFFFLNRPVFGGKLSRLSFHKMKSTTSQHRT